MTNIEIDEKDLDCDSISLQGFIIWSSLDSFERSLLKCIKFIIKLTSYFNKSFKIYAIYWLSIIRPFRALILWL